MLGNNIKENPRILSTFFHCLEIRSIRNCFEIMTELYRFVNDNRGYTVPNVPYYSIPIFDIAIIDRIKQVDKYVPNMLSLRIFYNAGKKYTRNYNSRNFS